MPEGIQIKSNLILKEYNKEVLTKNLIDNNPKIEKEAVQNLTDQELSQENEPDEIQTTVYKGKLLVLNTEKSGVVYLDIAKHLSNDKVDV